MNNYITVCIVLCLLFVLSDDLYISDMMIRINSKKSLSLPYHSGGDLTKLGNLITGYGHVVEDMTAMVSASQAAPRASIHMKQSSSETHLTLH